MIWEDELRHNNRRHVWWGFFLGMLTATLLMTVVTLGLLLYWEAL